jgi:short-subunit dehydrogenase
MARPVALVTGASVGIGEQFARILAERGNDLVLVARDEGRLQALAKELHDHHKVHVDVLAADLVERDQLARVEARATAVDTLVNNAGFGSFGSFHELDIENEEQQIRLNIVALVRLTHAASRGMVERGRGAILNVASLAGFQPTPNDATYAATKAFVLSFTQAVHEELKGKGVAVTVLAPGFTCTQFQERASFDPRSVPGFLWHEAEPVARAGLDGLARNRAIVVPGTVYRAVAGLSSVSPYALTRRVARVVVRRA